MDVLKKYDDIGEVPLGEATYALRHTLIALAEKYEDLDQKPCCDAETTLNDWRQVLTDEEITASFVPSDAELLHWQEIDKKSWPRYGKVGLNMPVSVFHPLRLRSNSTLTPDGRRNSWGPIDKIHRIGDIEIVEYRVDNSRLTGDWLRTWREHGTKRYSSYIYGVGTHHSSETLDSAVVQAIAHKRDGANSQAALMFDRMTRATKY